VLAPKCAIGREFAARRDAVVTTSMDASIVTVACASGLRNQ
jgi:hypothetical protein